MLDYPFSPKEWFRAEEKWFSFKGTKKELSMKHQNIYEKYFSDKVLSDNQIVSLRIRLN